MSKKASKAQQIANRDKKDRNHVARMWAENGLVMVETTRGEILTKTVPVAAQEAAELNKMFPPRTGHKVPAGLKADMDRTHKFIEQIIQVCREAKAQQLDTGNDKAQKLDNLFKGLSPDGSKAKEETMDNRYERLAIINHLLTEQEIATVMENPTGSIPEKEHLLMEMHLQRASDIATEQNARAHAASEGIILT